jgi:hypothetical protein
MPHSVIPIVRKKQNRLVLAIVFHDDGLERIKNHDPAVVDGDIITQATGLPELPLTLLDIMVCYEEDDPQTLANKLKALGDSEAVLKYLSRNWENRPGEDERLVAIIRPIPVEL